MFRQINLLFSIALAILYALTAPSYLPDTDGPQFVVIGITGGIAHPPGYPLYCFLLRLINLAVQDPELSFAAFGYFSAVLSGFGSFLILDLLTRIGVSAGSRIMAVGVVFTSFSVWHVSNNIEPFALNLSLCAAVVWCLTSLICKDAEFPICGPLVIFALGLLFGFGFCNHHTQALLVPMTLITIVKTSPQREGILRDILFFSTGFILGLLPISYFYLTNLEAPMVWGLTDWRDQPFSRLITHLFRREYGTFRLVRSQVVDWRAPFMFKNLLESMMYIGAPLCALAFRCAIKNQKVKETNRNFFTICLMINILPITLFFLMAQAGQGNFADAILSRFVAMPAMLFCPLMALGMEDVRQRFKSLASWPFVLSILLLDITINLPAADRRLQRLPEFTLKTMLDLSKEGFLIGGSDFTWAGVPFLQVVRGFGTDVKMLQPHEIRVKANRELLFKKLGLPFLAGKSLDEFYDFAIDNGGLAFEFPQVGHPIMDRLYPVGPIYLAGKNGAPDPKTLFYINENIYQELLKSSLLNKNLLASDWERFILEYHRQPWTLLSDALKKDHPELADKARAYEKQFTIDGKHEPIKQDKSQY